MFMFSFVIISLQILILIATLHRSVESKKEEEIKDLEIQIKYLALHHFKSYMNMKLSQIDINEIEEYLVDNIMCDCDCKEEDIRKIIKPFLKTLLDEFKF